MLATIPAFLPLGSWTTLDVVNHLWQSTVAGLAVLGLLLACASLSARTRRALGLMALAKFVVPIAALTGLVTRFGGAPERWLESPALTLPVSLSPGIAVSAPPVSTSLSISDAVPLVAPQAPLPIGLLLAAAWAAGFVAIFGWWGVRGLRLRRRILASAQPVSAAIAQGAAGAAARAGLRDVPRCATVADTHDAGVLGVWSPVVILPRGLDDTLTPAELEAVLIHEFVHVQRRDNLWGAVQFFLASLFWFHPLVWLLNRRIGLEAEKACDERVLELTGDPDVYAAGIVKCVRHALGVAQPGLAGVATPPVVARMKNILDHGLRRDRPLVRVAVLVTGAMLVALSGQAGSFVTKALAAEAAPEPVVLPPMRETDARAVSAPPQGQLVIDSQRAANGNETKAGANPAPGRPVDTRIKFGDAEPRPIPKYQYNQQTGGFEVSGFEYLKMVTVDFEDEEIVTILRKVADFLELNIVVPDTLRGKKATLKAANKTWREIFWTILRPQGFTIAEVRNIVRIIPDRSPQTSADQMERSSRGVLVTGGPRSTAAKDTLSVDFPDEDVRNIIRNVADLFKLNVIMPDALQGKTTIKLRDVTWRQIFQVVLESAGYTFVEDGDTIRIVTKESLVADEPVTTEIFRINYAKAADLAPTISSLVDPAKGKVTVDARTNTLVITERPSRLRRIHVLIEQLDVPPAKTVAAPAATDQIQNERAVAYLNGEAARLKREAELAQQRLNASRTSPLGGLASEAERAALEREAQATAANYAAVQERLRLTQDAAVVTAESARLLAVAAERDALLKQRRAQEAEAQPQKAMTVEEVVPIAPAATDALLQPPPPPRLTPPELAQNVARPSGAGGLLRGVQVFDVSKLDQTPVPKFQAAPQYPFEMRRQNVSGEVLVDFIIDTNGDVQNAYAVKSSRSEFEAAAVQAVSKWKFRPGRKGGRDVPTHMQVPIVFSLNAR